MNQAAASNKIVQKATLYRVVFDAVAVRYIVAFMFIFFVLHPAVPAFASEDVAESDQGEVVAEPEPEPEPEVVSESDNTVQEEEIEETIPDVDEVVLTESEEVVENSNTEEDQAIQGENASTTQEPAVEEEVPTNNGGEVTNIPSDGSSSDTNSNVSPTSASGADDADTETESDIPQTDLEDLSKLLASSTPSEESNEEVTNPVPEVAGASTTTDEADVVSEDTVLNEELSSSEDEMTYEDTNEDTHTTADSESEDSSKTDEEDISGDELLEVVPDAEYVEVQNFVEHTDAAYQFNKTQCISMGDGGFYCTKVQDAVAHASVDGVFAELDSDGDLEIYIRTDGNTTQITDNTYDDSAPSYDAVSDTITWHRLIEGRYQIISYSDGVERQITQSRNNSMEPNRSGEYTVWQEWVDTNWEIMLFDGNDISQITDTPEHEVAPYIQGGYVIWTVTNGAKSSVSVYDIKTGLLSAIDDTEGGRVENPRFVLVYDTKFENGDVITKGFDPETGEVVPLSAQAGEVPVDIPSSDTTGETRALIQNKSSNSREDFTEEITGNTASSSASSASSTPAAADAQQVLDLSESSPSEEATTTPSEILPLTDFDIIVEPFSASSSAQDTGSASSIQTVE